MFLQNALADDTQVINITRKLVFEALTMHFGEVRWGTEVSGSVT